MDTLFKNADLLAADGSITRNIDILVQGNQIAQIGTGLAAPGAQVIDCAGLYITPGLTNMHAHSPMHILRGLAEDVHIDDWFNQEVFPYESKLSEEDVYWGARLCCAEMLDNGVTAFADHYFFAEQVLQAADDAGIRIDLALTSFGQNVEKEVADTVRLAQQYSDNERVRLRIGPHSPYLVPPQQLAQLVQAAKANNMGIHIHASETQVEEQQSQERFGKTHIQLIAEAGGFEVPCIIAHGLWMSDADLTLLGADTYVAACPKTYMKLGAGKGTLWDNWQKINLCIGTDGACSSNAAIPLEQAQLFALCGKWEDKAADYKLPDIWQALMRGHNALPFGTGNLVAGAPADLVVWDLNKPSTMAVHNPLAALIYSAGAGNVRHTMVAGNFAKKDGELQIDMQQLVQEATRCARALNKRGKGVANVVF